MSPRWPAASRIGAVRLRCTGYGAGAGAPGADERDLEFGTAAVNALAIAAGASIVRVHDVSAAVPAVRMAAAMSGRDQRFKHNA